MLIGDVGKVRRRRGPVKGRADACLCGGGEGAGIECDGCHGWLHIQCVGMGQVQARGLRRWMCPVCVSAKEAGQAGSLEDVRLAARTHLTPVPTAEELRGALDRLAMLSWRVPLEDRVAQVLEGHSR